MPRYKNRPMPAKGRPDIKRPVKAFPRSARTLEWGWTANPVTEPDAGIVVTEKTPNDCNQLLLSRDEAKDLAQGLLELLEDQA